MTPLQEYLLELEPVEFLEKIAGRQFDYKIRLAAYHKLELKQHVCKHDYGKWPNSSNNCKLCDYNENLGVYNG